MSTRDPKHPSYLTPVEQPARSADEHAAGESARKRALYDWADELLNKIGLTKRINTAETLQDLECIVLDLDDPDIIQAVHEATHPGQGHLRKEHFRGFKEAQLLRILQSRSAELKKPKINRLHREREATETEDDRKHHVVYYGSEYKVTDRGVFFRVQVPSDPLMEALSGPMYEWLPITRSRIDLLEVTRSIHDDDWGTYISFVNRDGRSNRLAISASIITDTSGNIAGELQSLGVDVVRHCRKELPDFLLTNVPARILAVPSIGWWQLKNGAWTFVLPDETFLPPAFRGESAVLQTKRLHPEHGFSVAGTATEWREQIAGPFAGNSIVMLAVGQALAGPLTNWAGVPPGIFHVHCPSKFGKSLASAIGQSVWGPPLVPVRRRAGEDHRGQRV